MADGVPFRIGPVPADLAIAWLDNSKTLVAGVRRHRFQLAIHVDTQMLELCDALLDIWSAHASSTDTFLWTADTDADQVVFLTKQWLEIGALTDDELKLIGCTWAPEWTRPFADALVVGALAALQRAGKEGEALSERLRSED